MNKRHFITRFTEIAVIILIVVAGFGSAVQHLWNLLLPELLGLPAVGYWQALGLMLLCWLLFGGMRGFGMHSSEGRGRSRHVESMSPEERARLRKALEAIDNG